METNRYLIDNNHFIMTLLFPSLLLMVFIYLILYTVKPSWLTIQGNDGLITNSYNFIGAFVLSLIITILVIMIVWIIYQIIVRYKTISIKKS